jgi:DNA polymerase-3 subunit gamma/tau
MTLYLKYRPQTIDELDLASVRDTLGKLIAKNDLPHAFLFSGPKGAGKTSAARILAKVINCDRNDKKLGEPCNECSQCSAITKGNHVDIIEMDAASNRGIDDIRSLRDSVLLAPSMARKRIYIIDEAHMLTTEAANAFLKTLEEPPPHVVFIFATTEPQRLPSTVRSRLFNVNFGRATNEEIARQLERVAKGEKVEIDSKLLEAIASVSDGSFREAIKVFEELVLVQGISTYEDGKDYLDRRSGGDPLVLLKSMADRDGKRSLELVEQMAGEGVDMAGFIEQMLIRLRGDVLGKQGVAGYEQIAFLETNESLELLEILLDVQSRVNKSGMSQLPLEIAVARWCRDIGASRKDPIASLQAGGQALQDDKRVGKKKVKKVDENSSVESDEILNQVQDDRVKVQGKSVHVPEGKLEDSVWYKILNETRARDAKVEALLRAAKPLGYGSGSLSVGVYYQFHKERLETTKIRTLFEDICAEHLGDRVRVSYVLKDRKKREDEAEDQSLTSDTPEDIINAAEEIFGN